MLIPIFSLLIAPVMAQECPARASMLDASLQAYEAAFSRMDDAAMTESRDAARAMLPCLVEPAIGGTAAAFHRMEGFDAFLENDLTRVHLALRASFALAPTYVPDPNVAPAGGALAGLIATARQSSDVADVKVDVPAHFTLLVDGQPARSLPGDRAAIVQVVNQQSTVVFTNWFLPGQEIPPQAFPATEPPPPHFPVLRVRAVVGVDVYGFRYRCEIDGGCGDGAVEGDWYLATDTLYDGLEHNVLIHAAPAGWIRATGWLPQFNRLGLDIHDRMLGYSVAKIDFEGDSGTATNLGTFTDHELRASIRWRFLHDTERTRWSIGPGIGAAFIGPALITSDEVPSSSGDYQFGSWKQDRFLPLIAAHGGIETLQGFFMLAEVGAGWDIKSRNVWTRDADVEIGWTFQNRYSLELAGEWALRYLTIDGGDFYVIDTRIGGQAGVGMVF